MKTLMLSGLAALSMLLFPSVASAAEQYGPFTVEEFDESSCNLSIGNDVGTFIMLLDTNDAMVVGAASSRIAIADGRSIKAYLKFDDYTATVEGVGYNDGQLSGVSIPLESAVGFFELLSSSNMLYVGVAQGNIVTLRVDEDMVSASIALIECADRLKASYW